MTATMATFGDRDHPAILLINAEAGPIGRWDDRLCRRLADATRFVIRYDGGVPSGGTPATAAGVIEALDTAGIRRAHVIGGPIARSVATGYPERVESLALIPPGGEPPNTSVPLIPPGGEPPNTSVPTLVFHHEAEPPPPMPGATLVPLPGGGDRCREAITTALLMRTSGGWDLQGDRLSAWSRKTGDVTGWFDRLYAAGVAGEVDMPWDRETPHPLLAEWARDHGIRGEGRRAIVSGCGLGADAEFLARLGFETTAFDVAPTAVRVARERHPATPVDYHVADLLDPPAAWIHRFDLVVDVFTVQALPSPPRPAAIVNLGRLVGPGGTLVVIAYRDDGTDAVVPPWPLTRDEIHAFTTDGLETVRLDEAVDTRREHTARWRAEFRRPMP